MANPQCMVAGRRAFRTRLSIPYPSRQHHLLPITPPDMMAGFYRRRSSGRPSSPTVSPLFIRRRRHRAAADRMAPPPNMKGVYFLAQIHEGVVPRSFASEVYAFNVGEERYWRGGQCAYGNGTWMRSPWRVGREEVAGS
mmetsp:Transcript_33025/g.60882  ORF Transcript_33025/g.60882 Transcript_33025/m.60882 type:complete len:139 (+) Transcript_33025:97-513(+)